MSEKVCGGERLICGGNFCVGGYCRGNTRCNQRDENVSNIKLHGLSRAGLSCAFADKYIDDFIHTLKCMYKSHYL